MPLTGAGLWHGVILTHNRRDGKILVPHRRQYDARPEPKLGAQRQAGTADRRW